MKPNVDALRQYLADIQNAHTEEAKKLLFQSLLTALFQHSKNALDLIQTMSKGAEKTIFNIPLPHRRIGRADMQYNRVIIEWEKDLKRTSAHAIEQLKAYLGGNIQSGRGDDFTLIATDGLDWRIYARIPSDLLFQDLADIQLRQIDRFTLSETNLSDFPIFLDRYLFKTERLQPTLADIAIHFGADSGAFTEVVSRIRAYVGDLNRHPDLALAYDEWKRFLSIAYGKFNDSPDVFFVHTYLSVFAKLIAYISLSPKKTIPVSQLQDILNGKAFAEFNVSRFVEEDFYYWVATEPHFEKLKVAFQFLADKLADYDFTRVQEDILKGLYQELIDIDTRHALGEYYTPDWLSELIMQDLPLEADSAILDPACGSGSFLRAALMQFKKDFPTLAPDALASRIVGIDIHPLAVQIAKTTILLALSDLIRKSRKPVALNVFLANSLLLPKELSDLLYGNGYAVEIAGKRYALSEGIFDDSQFFDEAIIFAEEQASRSMGKAGLSREAFAAQFKNKFPKQSAFADDIYRIYQSLKLAKEENRDGIWSFILRNSYKPFFLRRSFDFVVGNPPWFTYSSVANAEYQQSLLELAKRYRVAPASQATMPHLEIAAIFLAHSANYFLKPNGKLAFVLPRSFFTADQHDNTRSGAAEGFRLIEAWDLKEVSPLFNVPACVLFASATSAKTQTERAIPEKGIKGFSFAAKLDDTDMSLERALPALEKTPTRWHYSILVRKKKQTRSALARERFVNGAGSSPYAQEFRQGATIVPRNFYFIEVAQLYEGSPLDYEVLYVKSLILPEAKAPWKSLKIDHHIEVKFLYRTALAKNLLPFALVNPPLVVLPVAIAEESGKKRIELLTAEELLNRGYNRTCSWFEKAEALWEKHQTDRSKLNKMSLYDRLDYQRGLTEQDLNARYLVLYTASATDACAVVLDRTKLDAEFIVESVCYWHAPKSKREGHYLASFLNSGVANEKIKAFQASGLFGERHVHKKILDLPFPRFDAKDKRHLRLAQLGELCAKKAQAFIAKHYPNADFDARNLGRARNQLRAELSAELNAIDALVEALLSEAE